MALFSGDWACSAISAALLAAGICGVAAIALVPFLRRRPGTLRVSLACILLTTAATQTAVTRTTMRREALGDAFATSEPTGVRNLRVARYYVGGPGDRLTLMRFKADAATFGRLGAEPAPEQDDFVLGEYRNGSVSWQHAWDAIFPMAKGHAVRWWQDVPPMTRPVRYVGPPQKGKAPPGSTTILRDETTGETFVMIVAG